MLFLYTHKILIEYFFVIQNKKISLRISNNQIQVYYPSETDFKEERIQSFIKKGVERAYILEAAPVLTKRMEILALKYNFKLEFICD